MHNIQTHWPRLLGAVILSLALAACSGDSSQGGRAATGAPASAGQPGSGTNTSGSTINVVARNFAFSLDATKVSAGTHTFVVKNEGSATHNFKLNGNGVEQKTALLDAGQTASLTLDLKPGIYTYVCSLPGHDALGMKGSIAVSE